MAEILVRHCADLPRKGMLLLNLTRRLTLEVGHDSIVD
jgi:hypothetical protein